MLDSSALPSLCHGCLFDGSSNIQFPFLKPLVSLGRFTAIPMGEAVDQKSSQADCWRDQRGLQSPSQNSDCPAHDSSGQRTYAPSIRLSWASEIPRTEKKRVNVNSLQIQWHPGLCSVSSFLLLSHQPSGAPDILPICFLLARFTDSLVRDQRPLTLICWISLGAVQFRSSDRLKGWRPLLVSKSLLTHKLESRWKVVE